MIVEPTEVLNKTHLGTFLWLLKVHPSQVGVSRLSGAEVGCGESRA